MSPKPDVSGDKILEHVRKTYVLDARNVALLAGRSHVEASVYRVDADQGSYFLKLTPDVRATMSPLARHLADMGISRVLAPLRTRDGQISAQLGGLGASLYPFIEGETGFQTPLKEGQWTLLGSVVRAIHDVKLPPSVIDLIRKEKYSDVWRSATRRYMNAAPSEYRDDSVAGELIYFLSSKRAEITMLVEHAEVLVPSLRYKALPQVPCHGDLHAGNVLSDRVGSLMIVDWDDPVLAAKERDLMFVGAGIGGAWNREGESAAFDRGYGSVNVDAEALAYYRCERIVEDVATFCDRLLRQTGETDAEREYVLGTFVTAFDPNDVVEIALRTFAAL